jgi:hypothetical protein
MNAESNAPKLAKPARPVEAFSSFAGGSAAHGDVAFFPAQQSAVDSGSRGSSAMLIFLLHFCGKPMLADRLHQLVDRNIARAITDKQQIEVFFRLDLSVPFVFDRRHTFKL